MDDFILQNLCGGVPHFFHVLDIDGADVMFLGASLVSMVGLGFKFKSEDKMGRFFRKSRDKKAGIYNVISWQMLFDD